MFCLKARKHQWVLKAKNEKKNNENGLNKRKTQNFLEQKCKVRTF